MPSEIPQADWRAEQHFEQDQPWEWRAFQLGDETILAHGTEGPTPDAYRVEKTTQNPRVLASADAVLYNGVITTPYYDQDVKTVVLQHFYAGRIESFFAEELLEDPAVVLEALHDLGASPVEAFDGRIQFTCMDCGEEVDREPHQLDVPGLTPSRCTSCTFDRMGERSR